MLPLRRYILDQFDEDLITSIDDEAAEVAEAAENAFRERDRDFDAACTSKNGVNKTSFLRLCCSRGCEAINLQMMRN